MEKTIKDLDIFISDGNYSSKYPRSEEFVEEGIPFIRGNNMADGDISDDEMYYITPEKHAILLKGHVKAGDVLITTRGNIGQVAIVPERHEDSNINAQIVLLRTNPESLYNRYLLWALQSHRANEQYIALQTGTALKQLPVGKLEKLSIKVADIVEQHDIANALDKVYEVVKKRRKELLLLDNLIKARFIELFGNGHDGVCNVKMLGDFCKFQQGTQVPVEEQIEEPLDGYTRFLRIIDYTQAPQPPRYVAVKGREIEADSVVIVRYGATAGFVGRGYAGILANNLFEVVPDETILSKDFLYLALKYGTFEQEVHDKAFGAAMPALSFGMMNDISVVTPSSDEQDYFVDFVHQVDKSKFMKIDYINKTRRFPL